MNSVTVELWLSLGHDLGNDWVSVSAVRSLLETQVEEGTTVQELFDTLAMSYDAIRRKVFDNQSFSAGVVLKINEGLIPLGQVLARKIEQGDNITVLPVYAGG
jgi:sulfur carrier protein ThiS